MSLRTIATGTLGLIVALVWMLAFVYQRHNVGLLAGWALADAPVALRVSSAWSVLQIWVTALLAIPVALASVATMFGAGSTRRLLRIALGTGATMSAGVLTICAVLAVPRVVDGGPFLLANPRIEYELLVALATLLLQVAMWAISRRNDHSDPAARAAAHKQRPIVDRASQPSRHSTRRIALPAPR